MEAAGANNVMAEFYTIAETGLPELFSKQLGIYRRRPVSTWLYHWTHWYMGDARHTLQFQP